MAVTEIEPPLVERVTSLMALVVPTATLPKLILAGFTVRLAGGAV